MGLFVCCKWMKEVEASVYFASGGLFRLAFLGILVLAAWSDWRRYRIPNKIVAFGVMIGIVSICFQGIFVETFVETEQRVRWLLKNESFYLLRILLVMAAGYPLFKAGMTGAGDIKLAALLAGWLGLKQTVMVLCTGLFLGAVLSLFKMLREGSAFQRFLYLSAYIRQTLSCKKLEKYYIPDRDGTGCVIPLGACFCAGTLVILLGMGCV